ncbi:hypothetical protein FACS1894139_10850 [Planctomycetales bacterium]|nr:hypothetical protein FACS1894107_10190 [Planctomycetales bacterium]GHS99120.1 hypothetical protein FACS1894108_08500 [Planctomycetales bacterium]GHT05993.1 hypothetical protein FACS1894139_10850 [Planctomycetales bacterium]
MDGDKKTLYVESTIPSYATARESSDRIVATRQFITRRFWEKERKKYTLYTSQYTLDECRLGNVDAAKKRLAFLSGITILPQTEAVENLAAVYFRLLKIPEKARTDCSHLAVCALNRIDYLLSWNFAHLGVKSQMAVYDYNLKNGLWTSLLLSPDSIYTFDEEEELR